MLTKLILRQAEVGVDESGASKETPPLASQTTQTDAAKVEAAGSSTDEYGYHKDPAGSETSQAGKEAKVDDKKAQAKTDSGKEEDIKDPATGYGKPIEPPVAEPPPPAPEPKVELAYEVDTKDLDPKVATQLKEFAKTNGLTKEAAQAFINLRKSEIAAAEISKTEAQKAQGREIAELKTSWDKELRTHPTFGGDKFAHNVMRSEKVLSEFMPETKKMLTERSSMLPPYVMRDLAKLADHLYSTDRLIQGEAGGVKETKKEIDPLDFYNQ